MGTNELEKLLPEDYEQTCYDTKAISKKQTIRSPLDLLILIFVSNYQMCRKALAGIPK